MKFYFFLGFLHFHLYGIPLKTLSYSSAKKWLKNNDTNEIIYGDENYQTNCEHIVPQSFIKEYKIDQKSRNDLHLLYLSNPKLNSHRQNYKFNNLDFSFIPLDENGTNNNNKIHSKKNINLKEFEPPEKSKGKIARSIGYFYWNYSPVFEDKLLDRKLLVDWNKRYKVTNEEKERNEKILQIQKNKNIFIEYPCLISFCFSPPIFFLRKYFDSN